VGSTPTFGIIKMKNQCCDPDAPVKTCVMCKGLVHTCERKVAVDNDYRCPVHGQGVELFNGSWVCSEICHWNYYKEVNKEIVS